MIDLAEQKATILNRRLSHPAGRHALSIIMEMKIRKPVAHVPPHVGLDLIMTSKTV